MKKLTLAVMVLGSLISNITFAEVICKDLVLTVHQGANFVLLNDDKVWTGDSNKYGKVDFMMAMSPYGGPLIQLVGNLETQEYSTALDLGVVDFDSILEVPFEGYRKDNGTDFVIGTKYKVPGGNCDGLNMSNRVFAIKTSEELFAIITVVRAARGVITVKSCIQDNGSNQF